MPLRDLQFINDRKIFLKVRASAMQNHRAIQIFQDNREKPSKIYYAYVSNTIASGSIQSCNYCIPPIPAGGSGEKFRLI